MSRPEQDDLGDLIRREATRHPPPAELAGRLRAALQLGESPLAVRPAPLRQPLWRRGWPGLAAFVTGAAGAWCVALLVLSRPVPDAMAEAVTASHVRSLMASHLVDVVSSDRHRVRPWFAGRLDFSPPVVDLAADGLLLSGGRLDYLDGQPVAALVYQAGPHVVNLFVWPAKGDAATSASAPSLRGYNLVHWTQAGMRFWAVSDLNAVELQNFSALLRQRMTAPPS
jgi:anti-sigma factor RsiW